MASVFEGLKPESLWAHFEEILKPIYTPKNSTMIHNGNKSAPTMLLLSTYNSAHIPMSNDTSSYFSQSLKQTI